MFARLNASGNIVECGTSIEVSTIYIAPAICHNLGVHHFDDAGVLTIEKDDLKVKAAQAIWTEAGDEVKDMIISRQGGGLLEMLTNKNILPATANLLFLDGVSS